MSRLMVGLVFSAATFSGFGCGGETKHHDDERQAPDGGAGKAPDASAPTSQDCPAPDTLLDPTRLIDDMEDGDPYIPTVARRNGGWWTAGDDTPGASMVPEQTALHDVLAAPELLPKPRCGSHYAMHVTGQGFADWGALLGLALVWGTTKNGEEGALAYDASAYQGVEFYARIGDTSTDDVRFEISDSNSEPEGGRCKVGAGVGEDCYDNFGVPTYPTTAWRHYTVPFKGLAQQGFGLPANALVASAIYQFNFHFASSTVFDLWVDDLKFY